MSFMIWENVRNYITLTLHIIKKERNFIMRKKLLCVSMCVAMAASVLAGCGSKDDKKDDTTKGAGDDATTTAASGEEGGDEVGDASKGKVYYLNFKPESEDAWKKVADAFTADTGIEVKVVTAASGTYESTLKSEMGKSEAPTLFQINGPVGYATWKDYCEDLASTDFANWVFDKSLLVTDGDGVYGVPYCVESYGIICNKKIFEAYFALDGRADTGCAKLEDINSFAKLKAVADDMQAHKDDLGIKGAFSSAGMDSSSDWRFKTHLLNVAISAEFKDAGADDMDEIEFKYADNFKQMWDLYITDSTCEPGMLGQKTGGDSTSEFALGEAAMYQNGVWAWGDIAKSEGAKVTEADIAYLPIYMGLEGEENQGLCTGTENYMCVNKEASADDKAATIKFVEWVFGSDAGKKMVSEDLGFLTSFTTFKPEEAPADPLKLAAAAYNSNASLTPVSWVGMNHMPSEEFKNVVGADMLQYAQGSMDWSQVKDDTIQSWADEKALSK